MVVVIVGVVVGVLLLPPHYYYFSPRVEDSTVCFFIGNDTGANSAAELSAEARGPSMRGQSQS